MTLHILIHENKVFGRCLLSTQLHNRVIRRSHTHCSNTVQIGGYLKILDYKHGFHTAHFNFLYFIFIFIFISLRCKISSIEAFFIALKTSVSRLEMNF